MCIHKLHLYLNATIKQACLYGNKAKLLTHSVFTWLNIVANVNFWIKLIPQVFVKKVVMSKDCPSDVVQAAHLWEVYHFGAIELWWESVSHVV